MTKQTAVVVGVGPGLGAALEVAVFNAGAFVRGSILETDPSKLAEHVHV